MAQAIKGDIGVPLGRIRRNQTTVTLVNNTQLQEVIGTTAGERWVLEFIKLTNPDDVNRRVTIILYGDVALTVELLTLFDETVNAGAEAVWPRKNHADDQDVMWNIDYGAIILDRVNALRITWYAGGASAGGADVDGLIVSAVEVRV